jgi:hypothetical protein
VALEKRGVTVLKSPGPASERGFGKAPAGERPGHRPGLVFRCAQVEGPSTEGLLGDVGDLVGHEFDPRVRRQVERAGRHEYVSPRRARIRAQGTGHTVSRLVVVEADGPKVEPKRSLQRITETV